MFDSNGSNLNFKLDDAPVRKSLFGVGTRNIRANGCVHCGHLQLAVDFSEESFQRYQQFDGKQPGVLERISSERME